MSDAIKAGDLVMIVKPTLCCNNRQSIGLICTVGDGRNRVRYSSCVACGDVKENNLLSLADGLYVDFERVIKIPPLAELEDTTTDTPIKELA